MKKLNKNGQALVEYVVIIGLGNKLEIWDKGTYQKFKQETDVTYAEIAEKIDKEE